MKLRLKYWKPIAIGIGLFCLLIFSRCHLVSLPMRKADAQLEMKLTGYCACKKCCGWKTSWYGMSVYAAGPRKGKLKTIGQTASGRIARPGTVAVDLKVFPLGTKFYIPGYGYGIARDTGGNIKGRHLDLYFWLHSSGTNWGARHKKVKVWYPR